MIDADIHVIGNSEGDDIHLHLHIKDEKAPLVFIQHGLAGSITDGMYRRIRSAYHAHGWNSISVECSNSVNGAGGDIANFTIARHIMDLADAIDWVQAQRIVPETFALCGHSMGGHSVLRNAARLGNQISHVISSGTVTTGQNLMTGMSSVPAYQMDNWKREGFVEFDNYVNGTLHTGKVPFGAWDEWRTHDIHPHLDEITSPVLFVVGNDDQNTRPEHIQVAHHRIKDQSEFHTVAGAGHCYPENLDGFEDVLKDYLSKMGV